MTLDTDPRSGSSTLLLDTTCHIEAYAAENPSQVGCIRVAQAQRSLAPAPRFVFGPFPAHLGAGLFGGTRHHALDCYLLRDGRVGFDGIVSHGHTALWTLSINHAEDYVRARFDRRATMAVRRIKGIAACIQSPGYTIYGHWLVDILPRLAILEWAGYDIFNLLFILPRDCPAFALQMLQRIGIPPAHLIAYDPATELVQCDELLVPTTFSTGGRLHSRFAAATRNWIDRILPDTEAAPPDRLLFISRARIPSARNLTNRPAIEDLARAAGFAIIHPEQLDLPSQIRLFRSARQIIGEYGSGLHATIYGGSALHCCALRGTSHFPGFVQSNLAQAFGQSTSYVLGETPPAAVTYDFTIDEADFRRALDCLDVERMPVGPQAA